MTEHRDEHTSPFVTNPNNHKNKHRGPYSLDECESESCVECSLKTSGRHTNRHYDAIKTMTGVGWAL
jgi:hypothetical protein